MTNSTNIELTHVRSFDRTEIGCHRTGAGPVLVLVHGSAADHTRWAPVVPALAERFTTVAIDRRGRGASSDADAYSIEAEFADVVAVIDSIQSPVNVLGHSYGAVCCLEAALRTPNIRRLVLYEPPLPIGLGVDRPELLEQLEARLHAGDHEGVLTAYLREVVGMSAAEIDVLRGDPSWPARVSAAPTIPRELRSAETFAPDLRRYATLAVPTLLLSGGSSPSVLTEPTRRLSEVVSASRLAVMPGQQHVAMNTAPKLFVEHVVRFLS
jgi:pimeloyl-ACP methyl ester carboxylesterase